MEQIDFSNTKIDKSLKTISISKVLSLIQKEFDKEGVAQKTFDKNFNNPDSKYYKMTLEEIKESWEQKGADSRKYGSMLDDYIGMNLLGNNDKLNVWKLDNNYDYDERLKNVCTSFDDFYSILSKSGNTEFVTREKEVYFKFGDFYVKGRFDALFKNKQTGKWIIIDWKSSGDIDKKKSPWTDNLLGPACIYPALNWYTYTIQLFFYKKALIANYFPEGTTEDDVEVMIVQLPGHIIKESNTDFCIHKPAFKYDSEFMEKIFNFAISKNQLING